MSWKHPKKPIEEITAVTVVNDTVAEVKQVVSESEFNTAMARQGLVGSDAKAFNDLGNISGYIDDIGWVKVQAAIAAVNTQRLNRIMAEMATQIADEVGSKKKKGKAERIALLVRTAGYLASKLTQAQKMTVDMTGGQRKQRERDADNAPKNKGFIPGQDVKPGSTMVVGNEVHIHQGEKSG